jgi:inorganic pyrophosphatase
MSKSVNIIIETPRGSTQKYAFDKKTGLFKLKKIMPAGMIFPFDFGFIPDTTGEDGDPLDAMIISEFASFPGCMIECRPIGVLKAEQKSKKEKIRNDRYFFVPVLSKQFEHIDSLDDMPENQLKEIEEFFIQYNKIEEKEFHVLGIESPKTAIKLLSKNE